MAAFASLAALAITMAMAGCGTRQEAHRELTERQRDSLIGESDLPGSKVVKRALHESDDAAKRAAAFDSLTK